MKDITLFHFGGREVRVVVDERTGEPFWVAMDIAKVLDYSDTQAMTRRLDEYEVSTYTDNSSGQVRHIKIVNESGLYNAILGSNKPEAKRFKKWVTSEVLPSIRKTGVYALEERARYRVLGYKSQLVQKNKKIAKLERRVKELESKQTKEQKPKSDILGDDASLHNNFLDFLYMGNLAVHQIGHLSQKHKELKSVHESLTNFMHFIMLRHSDIRGVKARIRQLFAPDEWMKKREMEFTLGG